MHIQADSELQAAANLIAKYSGFVIDWSRALEIPTCIEDLERVSYSSNYRIRKIKLTDIESKKFFIPVLAYEKNSNSPIILYCSGNRVFKERISHSESDSRLLSKLDNCFVASSAQMLIYFMHTALLRFIYSLHLPHWNKFTKKSSDISFETLQEDVWIIYPCVKEEMLAIKGFLHTMIGFIKKDGLLIIILSAIAGFSSLLLILFASYIIEYVVPIGQIYPLMLLGIIFFFGLIISNIFCALEQIVITRLSMKVKVYLFPIFWDHILRLYPNFFLKFSSADLLNRMISIQDLIISIFRRTLGLQMHLIGMIVNLLFMLYCSNTLAIISILCCTAIVIIDILFAKIYIQYKRHLLEYAAKLAATSIECFTSICKIKSSNKEESVITNWKSILLKHKSVLRSICMIDNIRFVISGAFYRASTALVYLAIHSCNLELAIGVIFSFIVASSQFSILFFRLSNSVIYIMQLRPVMERALPIIESKREATDIKLHHKLKGSIKFHNVTFSYKGSSTVVLDNASFEVKRGKTVAIIGASRSGKSTILKLLLGFENADSGEIYYDNINLNNIDIYNLRAQIGSVLQNHTLIPGTIYTNITTSNKISLEDARIISSIACLEEDIKKMPMGMDTIVCERGSTLSGGQRQKLMIARAIACNPTVLLLDEATSALDNHSQYLISKNIRKLGITQIIIAHRLSTIQNADLILTIKNGQVHM